ncbi:MAG: hypothetical protein V7K97_02920 [Nostoc sp.]
MDGSDQISDSESFRVDAVGIVTVALHHKKLHATCGMEFLVISH